LVDLSSFISFLNAISSIAVILGAIFIVFQLKQNAKLIQATIRETRANASIALLEKRYKVKVNAWGNFQWLAEETRSHLKRKETFSTAAGT